MGPLLLLVIPAFGLAGPERKIDLEDQLQFTLNFYSDAKLDAATAQLPILKITTNQVVSLEPQVREEAGGGRHFTYDVTIRNTPWFILREATIHLSDGQSLVIPETKFELGQSIAVNLWEPIAP